MAWKIVAAVTCGRGDCRGGGDGTDSQPDRQRHERRERTRRRQPKTSGASARTTPRTAARARRSEPDRPLQGSAWEEAWADAKGKPIAWSPSGSSPRRSTSTRPWPAASRIPSCSSDATRRSTASRPRPTLRSQKVEAVARQHLRQRRFAQARAALQPALATFGPVPAADRARKLIEEIDQAEKRAPPPAEKPAEIPKCRKRRPSQPSCSNSVNSTRRSPRRWRRSRAAWRAGIFRERSGSRRSCNSTRRN